jgi:hypothetical protein
VITRETLAAVAAVPGKDVFGLRRDFPGVMFVVCEEDDVPARLEPILETSGHCFFLFTSASGHCLEFTNDFDLATGIVVATRADTSG